MRLILLATFGVFLGSCATTKGAQSISDRMDAIAAQAMRGTEAQGLAIALIENGKVIEVEAYGVRNEVGDPLTTDTIMYGASLTKAAFAYMALQLVDTGQLDLDRPIAALLPDPLTAYNADEDREAYGDWGGLAGDARWSAITPRHVLTHSTGFANFSFLEPDGRLRINFDPGTRYAYSGEGMMLLQFGLERGLGLEVGGEMQKRIFEPLNMTRTSLKWREDFADDLADGFAADGSVEPHDERSRVRVAGSMDTTISDMARLAEAMVNGFAVSEESRRAFAAPQLAINSRSQFPTLRPPPPEAAFSGVASGLGVIVFDGPQGRGFYKGGHNDTTGNTMVCIERGRRCVIILSNDVRAERAFPWIAKSLLGETGVPWLWEYGETSFWTPEP